MMEERMALVDSARRGDSAALAELLAACQPDIKRFARRTCSHAEDAEDAVQLALWQLHRKVGTLQTVVTFTKWLFRIVERECYRLFRLRSRWDTLDGEALDALPRHGVPLDLRLDLARAIAALPPIYRTVLILRDVDELTTLEVAAQLGISLEAVKSRLHRARALVRERLVTSGYWEKDGEASPR